MKYSIFDLLDNDDEIFPALRQTCAENDYSVDVCGCFLEGGELNHEKIKIIKIDEILASKNIHNPPKSVDCLILMKKQADFKVVMVELRNIGKIGGITRQEIDDKFSSSIAYIEQKMEKLLDGVFDFFKVVEVEFIVVTDPFKGKDQNEGFHRANRNTALDQIRNIKPKKCFGQLAAIKVMRPNPVVCFE